MVRVSGPKLKLSIFTSAVCAGCGFAGAAGKLTLPTASIEKAVKHAMVQLVNRKVFLSIVFPFFFS
jgi:hypothetical protein